MSDATNFSSREHCPNRDSHTPAPAGYLAWHAWAERKNRTHVQRKCPGCGLYSIWQRKEGAS